MSKPKYTIAVTGLNAIDSPGPGMAVIKSLREAESFDVRIIGLSYETMEPGIYLHHLVDKTYQVPYPQAGTEVLFQRLAYINSVENLDMVIPNFDAELHNYILLADRLKADLGISSFVPSESQFAERHKSELNDFGEKHDIKVPQAKMAFTPGDAAGIAAEFGFPVAIKGKFYDAKIAYTPQQAMQHFHKISAEWGLPILVQEFVNGHEVNLCGVGDGQGNTVGAVPMKKKYVTEKGKAWSGITIDDKKLLEMCHQFTSKTKWQGPFELEVMKNEKDEYYLLEINPRFPAWCYLTTGAGQNQVEAVVNLAINGKTDQLGDYTVGKMFIRHSDDMVIDIKEFEQISTTGEL